MHKLRMLLSSKLVLSLLVTIAIILTIILVPALTAKAVEVSIQNLPSQMVSGVYSFYAQININTNEQIPIIDIRLDVAGPTIVYAVFNANGTITSQSGQFVSIVPVVTAPYGYGYGYGYGYAHRYEAEGKEADEEQEKVVGATRAGAILPPPDPRGKT